jgi:CheY-like chemotaxis protein
MASGDLGTLDGAMSLERRRVLIIDGHLAVGRGLKALVEEMPGLRVVGLCTRGERGLAQAAETTPDIALVDAERPGLCSAAVIRLLRWRLPRTRVVALGTYPERQRLALAAGAHEFVLKDAGYDALYSAITRGAGGTGDVAGGAGAGPLSERGHSGTAETVYRVTANIAGRPAVRGERVLS